MSDLINPLGGGFDAMASMSAMTPFLSSYSGLSDSSLEGLATLQASYHPQAPMANQEQALQLLQAASQATDPNLKNALMQQALALLTPGGQSSQPVAQPVTQPGSFFPSASPVNSTGAPSGAGSAESTPLTVNGNTIDTGRYTIAGSNGDDGSLTITDKQTGKTVEIWGDPHVKVDGQDVADFQQNGLTIQLQDGTQVHIQPTAVSNGVSHINQVAVMKGDQAVTMSGFHDGDMHTSAVMNGAAGYSNALYEAPGTTNITEGDDDNLYYNNADGSMGAEITAPSGGGETNLDGAGGGLINAPQAGTTSASNASPQDVSTQLAGAIQSYSSGMFQMEMMSLMSLLQSQSGFAQV